MLLLTRKTHKRNIDRRNHVCIIAEKRVQFSRCGKTLGTFWTFPTVWTPCMKQKCKLTIEGSFRNWPQFAVFERLVSRKYSNFDEKIDGQNRSCSHNNDWPSKKKSNTVNKISAFSEERNSDVRNTINHYNIRKSLGKRNFWVQTRGGSGRQKSRGW